MKAHPLLLLVMLALGFSSAQTNPRQQLAQVRAASLHQGAVAHVNSPDGNRGLPAVNVLPGYTAVREQGLDVVAWRIEKPGGLIIHFEAGTSEGLAVSTRDRAKYAWYREQFINGHRVLVALVRAGAEYSADLDRERSLPAANTLLVSYPLSGHKDHAANFVAKVANAEEMGDALLMALTFDPSKAAF